MRPPSLFLLTAVALYGQTQSLDDFLRVAQTKIEKKTDSSGKEYYSAKAELFCSSSKAITAYVIAYATTYADGTIKKGSLWADLVPTLPIAGAKVVGPTKAHLGLLRKGDTDYFPISLTVLAAKAIPTVVQAEVSAVVFDDCTTAGQDQKNVDWIFSYRQQSLKVYQSQLTALGDARRSASEDKVIAHLRSKLSSEEKGLTKNNLLRQLDSADKQVSLGQVSIRSWLDRYEKELTDYVNAFEKHQAKKGGQQ